VHGMATGYAVLGSNKALQIHWLRRIAAMLIDVAIIFIPIRIALIFVTPMNQDIFAGIATGMAWFVYAGILEGKYGKTLGKHLMHLKVVSMVDQRLLRQGFIRSIPKLFWYAFLPVDTLIGLAMDGDPRQRFTDRVSLTSVITFEPELAKIKKRSQPAKNIVKHIDDESIPDAVEN
jgi:uncharacterized RDD family membrane protein YckC